MDMDGINGVTGLRLHLDASPREDERVGADLDPVTRFEPRFAFNQGAVDVDTVGALQVEDAEAFAHALDDCVIAADCRVIELNSILFGASDGDSLLAAQVQESGICQY